MGPGTLKEVLKDLSIYDDGHTLVQGDTSDDAGVYQLTENIALVQTVDFFTPMVDDPYLFGKIAIANALSDVYAMGGIPKTALNVVTFPVNCLDPRILGEILRGGADKLVEAEVALLGGHTIEDDEPKYGASVTGIVDPKKMWKNQGAREGDVLILTKPLGVGLITTAIKGGLASDEEIAEASLNMEKLNKIGAAIALERDVHSCTDITGFGLIGHLLEMTDENITFEIDSSKLPFLKGALSYAKMGIIPQGSERNRKYVADRVTFMTEEYMTMALVTPETSGGLVFALTPEEGEAYIKAMEEKGEKAYNVGNVTSFKGDRILVK